MSWLDTLKANTVGLVYSSWTGNVDPYTRDIQRQATDVAIAQAGTGLSPQQVQAVQDQARREQDAALNLTNSNPYNPDGSLKLSLNVPYFGQVGTAAFLKKAETIVYVAIGVLVFGGLTYAFVQFGGVKFVKKALSK